MMINYKQLKFDEHILNINIYYFLSMPPVLSKLSDLKTFMMKSTKRKVIYIFYNIDYIRSCYSCDTIFIEDQIDKIKN